MIDTLELRNLTEDELQEKVGQMKKELMQTRFQAKTGKLERQSALKEKKRDIARILTVMNEKKNQKKGAEVTK